MPLSNQKGEGFENKIAQVIGNALGTGVQYYWRPSIERGLMRTTLSEGNCDLWMDMATDTEGAVVLNPLYRSTFVLAYRNDKGIDIKSLDDPALKKLRVGVFQVSAIREALSEHGVVNNTVIHYLSHNGDLVQENQPSYQVQQVIDGTLDVAAAWGPMAGYYKTVLHAPLIIQPVNMMEDARPDGIRHVARRAARPARHQSGHRAALARSTRPKSSRSWSTSASLWSSARNARSPATCLARTLRAGRTRAVTVRCGHREDASCANGRSQEMAGRRERTPTTSCSNAIVANDIDRVRYLLGHGAHADCARRRRLHAA